MYLILQQQPQQQQQNNSNSKVIHKIPEFKREPRKENECMSPLKSNTHSDANNRICLDCNIYFLLLFIFALFLRCSFIWFFFRFFFCCWLDFVSLCDHKCVCLIYISPRSISLHSSAMKPRTPHCLIHLSTTRHLKSEGSGEEIRKKETKYNKHTSLCGAYGTGHSEKALNHNHTTHTAQHSPAQPRTVEHFILATTGEFLLYSISFSLFFSPFRRC